MYLHHPQFLGWAYDLVARSAEDEWFPAWVTQSSCKVRILPQLGKWCLSCQGNAAYWRLWFRKEHRWTALPSTALNGGGCSASFFPSYFSLKVYAMGRPQTQGFLIESWSITLAGVIWTSPYSVEMRDLMSRECRAVWGFSEWEGHIKKILIWPTK